MSAMAERHSFGPAPITCHAFNGNRSELAISPNNHEVHVYAVRGGVWEKVSVLDEHTGRVTSVDWAVKSDRLVTCSADRNAYVWQRDGRGGWKPTLVLLRINRAATFVRWSPRENKFAVGSGARVIAICYFEEDKDWWASKHVKKPIRSTVTCLDWHPNNVLIAAGSSDFKCRLFSAYIKEVDANPDPTPWGANLPFADAIKEWSAPGRTDKGWVHAVAFSQSGAKVAWVAHDSCIYVVDSAHMTLTALKTDTLPFRCVQFVNEHHIAVAGYDCCPMLFGLNGGLHLRHKLDQHVGKQGVGRMSAMNRFQQTDKKGNADATETILDTVHQNAVGQMSIYSRAGENANRICTTGVDGMLVIWDVDAIKP